ncbi:MAG: glycosyltransferase family 1 protein [Candidatus Moranbacteria bacterium]|nr:glycosyltransferase family 1 protein [Bacteroidia bacterium]NCU31350.1 glycosyltransferase family 1 protein [Candidatus Moranbacteria bacterium]
MRIANVIRRLSFSEWGGTETAVWNSSRKLKYLGNEIEILSTTALCKIKKEIIENLDIYRFKYFYPQLFLSKSNSFLLDKKGGNPFSFSLHRHLIKGEYDLIHSHAMGRIAKIAQRAAHKKNIPFIISFHGGNYDVPPSELEEMQKPLKGSIGYGKLIERIFGLDGDIVAQSDGIICVGKNEFELVQKKFPGKKVAHIANGVDSSLFSKAVQTSFKSKYNIPENRKLLLCVSRVDYQKNQLALVKLLKELISKCENVHCAIIGFITSPSYFNKLKEDISRAGLTDRFTLVEGLPPQSDLLIGAYKDASLFVLPSIHEPFGIVVLEAWSAKLPAIASAVGGLKTLIKNGENGFLFDPSNLASMTRAYFDALDKKELLVKNAFREVNDYYSWEAITNQQLDFYKEVIYDFKKK